jgi:hypothetical protein
VPIDATSLARAFEIQRRILAPIFDRLGLWLDKRLKDAQLLDDKTRGFPILRLRDEALAMYIADHQKGAVLEPPSFAESVKSSGHAFVDGVAHIRTAIDESLGLLDLVGAVTRAVGAVRASVDRFAVPRPDMFNPDERRGSDLFGLAALGVRVALGSLDQILDAARDMAGVKKAVTDAIASPTTPGGPQVEATLGETLDEVARELLGGILILPAATAMLETIFAAAGQVIRREVLKTFDGVLRGVYGLRRQVFELFFAELPALLDWLEQNLLLADVLITVSLRFIFEFARLYVGDLVTALTDLTAQLKVVIDFWVDTILTFLKATDAIGNVNLTPVFMTLFIGIPGWLISKALPAYTIADLIRDGGQVLRVALIAVIAGARATLALRKANPLFWFKKTDFLRGVAEKLSLIQDIVSEALRGGPSMPDEVLDKSPVAHFADIGKTVLDPAVAVLGPKLKATRDTLSTEIGAIFTAGGDALVKLQTEFDAASAAAVHLGSPAGLTAIAKQADLHAGAAFGPQLDELGRRIAAAPEDPVAASFEKWLTGGGFDAVGKAIPAYIVELDRAWRERQGTPREASALLTDKMLTDTTSPHLLAKRKVRLARVEMKELRFRVTAPRVDEDLAERIADALGIQVAAAYARGRERLAEMHRTVHKRFDADQAKLAGKTQKKPAAAPAATPPPGGP